MLNSKFFNLLGQSDSDQIQDLIKIFHILADRQRVKQTVLQLIHCWPEPLNFLIQYV